jgi:hypothetical protein
MSITNLIPFHEILDTNDFSGIISPSSGVPCSRQVLQRGEPSEALSGGFLRSNFSPQRTGSPAAHLYQP